MSFGGRQQTTHTLCVKGKGKVRPRTGHEDPEGECRYRSILSLISALHVGGWLTPRPDRFTSAKEILCLSCRRLAGPQGQCGRVSPSPEFDPRSESL